MTRNEAERIVNDSLNELLEHESFLLEHDVSERAITHKLAEYLLRHVRNLNCDGDMDVDCEYNRNIELGDGSPKYINIIVQRRRAELGGRDAADVPEEELEAVSALPDIIVHRRGNNQRNKLIVEVKKQNSAIDDDYDETKLCAFTGNENGNNYRYEHGVFIKMTTDQPNPPRPVLKWFSEGREA